ncbi:hypothetical protein AN219_25305 [Streptomyces nanshensis]|nr:hypothetical protein AN219_25305 [Streptomyces nanshensis]
MHEGTRRAAAVLAAAIPLLAAAMAAVQLAALDSAISAGRPGYPEDDAEDAEEMWRAGLHDVAWDCGPLLLVGLLAVLFAHRLWRGSARSGGALACLAVPMLFAGYIALGADAVSGALWLGTSDTGSTLVDTPGWCEPASKALLWATAVVQLVLVVLLRPWQLLNEAAEPRLDPDRTRRGSWLLTAAAGLGLGLIGLYWAAFGITEARVQHLAEADDLHYAGLTLLWTGAPLALVCLALLALALPARRGVFWVTACVWPLNALMLSAVVLVGWAHPLKLDLIEEGADAGDDYGPVIDAIPGWYIPARIALSLAVVAVCFVAAKSLRSSRATGRDRAGPLGRRHGEYSATTTGP